MATFRCYALDRHGAIIAAENLQAEDQTSATAAAWGFVATIKGPCEGLEIWQGTSMVFTTIEPGPRKIRMPYIAENRLAGAPRLSDRRAAPRACPIT